MIKLKAKIPKTSVFIDLKINLFVILKLQKKTSKFY